MDVEAIAKGLTEAQRQLMRNHPFWATTRYTTIAACRRKGLLDGAEITALGLAVRNHLKGQQ